MSDMYAAGMKIQATQRKATTRRPRHSRAQHPGHVVVRCAWCWMFGEEKKPGTYEHMERPLTRHPFVPYMEVVGA